MNRLAPHSFGHVVGDTLCPFASITRWDELLAPADRTVAGETASLAAELRREIHRAEAAGLDMIALTVTDPVIAGALEPFVEFVGWLLLSLTDDPRSVGDDSVMLGEEWRLWVEDVRCFVLTFAPFYSRRHPRWSPTEAAYVVFQFESAFRRSGVSSLSEASLGRLSKTVTEAFERQGRWYLPEITHESPEALRVVKPLHPGDPPVVWWRFSEEHRRREFPMSYVERFRRDGHAVFDRFLPSRIWFDELYAAADLLIEELTDELAAEWRQAAFDWLAEGDNGSYYCGVPPAYRDRAGIAGKRNKAYIQWCLEHARSPRFAATRVARLEPVRILSRKMTELHEICSGAFESILADFAEPYPQLVARFDEGRPLPIVFKLVRYNQSPNRFATDPHFDKSGLSMILRADDETVRWRIGQGNPCRISEMSAPFEYPRDHAEPNPAVVFPGLCLEAAGVDVAPTPHFVLPVEQKRYRHSTIAFLVVPHLEGTDDLDTQAPFIHDALTQVD